MKILDFDVFLGMVYFEKVMSLIVKNKSNSHIASL